MELATVQIAVRYHGGDLVALVVGDREDVYLGRARVVRVDEVHRGGRRRRVFEERAAPLASGRLQCRPADVRDLAIRRGRNSDDPAGEEAQARSEGRRGGKEGRARAAAGS